MESQAKPWYRQFWPLFLLALPAAVILAGLATAWLAYRDADGLVVDDYYKQGLGVNQTLDRDRKAAELGLKAALRYRDGLLTVALSGRERPAALKLHLEHPTRAEQDREFLLSPDAAGLFKAEAADIAGSWYATLTPVPDTWRLTGAWRVPDEAELALAPRPVP